MKRHLICWLAAVVCLALQAETPRNYDPRADLVPGFRFSARVRFDEVRPNEVLIGKGLPSETGGWMLRVNPEREGRTFGLFLNTSGNCEPRVNGPAVEPNRWYAVEGGWDGTNAFLSVDGQCRRVRRRGAGARRFAGLRVTDGTCHVENLAFSSPLATEDVPLQPGLMLACKVRFDAPPKGLTTILQRKDQYWLRYDTDKAGGDGRFNFFVRLNGNWEPRASLPLSLEMGRAYAVAACWTGTDLLLQVDGQEVQVPRSGRPEGGKAPRTTGDFAGRVSDAFAGIDETPRIGVDDVMTQELLPRAGAPVNIKGTVRNLGGAKAGCRVTVRAEGLTIEPRETVLGTLETLDERPLVWRVPRVPATTDAVRLTFDLSVDGKHVGTNKKVLWLLPEKDPDFSARAWNPPCAPVRTYHVDSRTGDDARDGLSPATAWRSFAPIRGRTLGPGERLLLRRGCVFNDELTLTANGAPDNWAEIGAYGEGMRPQIRRNRDFNEECAFVSGARYLAVRDLVVCNAGAGLTVACTREGDGHVLVERCLAHHIEGGYRFNSHGIPEWWEAKGPGSGSRSQGLRIGGSRARHVVLRDCEAYQCSSGFNVGGVETFVTRVYCHDNYSPNTSPHPYDTASRSWLTDSVFEASGWQASAGTMGVMLANNGAFVIRGCHFLDQPDSGSHDQGGVDFECRGENCLIENCTFRRNAGAAIEVLGLRSPQTRNVTIRGCKFDRNNWARKNGPAEIQVWGDPKTPSAVACSNGLIADNGYVLVPGVPFYVNESPSSNRWELARNREFAFSEDLDAALPLPEPPAVRACSEIWTDNPSVALSAQVTEGATVAWEQLEGPSGVRFAAPGQARTRAEFPDAGDYRVTVRADNGVLWRSARTAVHVLPRGWSVCKTWDFATNLDSEGWTVSGTGTGYRYIKGREAFWDTRAFPVKIVCGDYWVIALQDATEACIETPDDRAVGVGRANALRIRLQNHTPSRRMRLYWQTAAAPTWSEANAVAFDVTPMAADDEVVTVALPRVGELMRLRLAFSADRQSVTGTVRIDYLALLTLPRP